jgi:hypothetical protein
MSKPRPPKPKVVLPTPILRRVHATAAVLGSTPTDVVVAGCRLFCTFVLRELAPTSSPTSPWKKKGPQWQVNEIVRVLASRFEPRLKK